MTERVEFCDILEPRRSQSSIFTFMTRAWDLQKSHKRDKYFSPQELKDLVANSVYLDNVIEVESKRTGINRNQLRREVNKYLEEMGLDKKTPVIRWMGIVFLKICFMMKIGVFVNEPAVLEHSSIIMALLLKQLKGIMGPNPVLFLPTHRSYADFCLMTYLCFHYNIEIPAVAAGMDFYSMAVIGRCMRDTSAFYIRRTLAGAPLYGATLRQYVRTVVGNHYAPVEFFLEGTRSRSNKALPPKYGMLSMSLAPYFEREVSDITIVPVNISYDRLMEHSLFAYEHLGVPKPKESTGGFIKSLRSLNDHFGNIYVNLGAPMSIREFLKHDQSTSETLKPIGLQELTPEQFDKVRDIAHHVVSLQQKISVATISNLLALVLMQSLYEGIALLYNEVLSEVEWMIQVLRNLGGSVFENDVRSSVNKILVVHSQMVKLDRQNRMRLVSKEFVNVSQEVNKKMKGHTLSAETMVNAVPIIQLQLYVNPVLHYIVPPSLIYLLVKAGDTCQDRLTADYKRIRTMLRHEFFHLEKDEEATFTHALQYCIQNKVVSTNNGALFAGEDRKLRSTLSWPATPALATLLMCAQVMAELKTCEHLHAIKQIQARLERSKCHPYCLSIEAITNCLQGLALVGALQKDKRQPQVIYEVVPDVLEQCRHLVSAILPKWSVDFNANNAVILNHKTSYQARL